jgi:DeoR/GlpR family transcriptional regulator of sugar metabolism
MVTYERQKKIFEYLKDKHFATMKELARVVWTSESSIRRDIKILEQKGVVRQIYGGVVLPEYENAVVPVTIRDGANAHLKDAIAKRAAEQLFNGATVIMDGSSTVRRIVNHIDKFRDLRIITNNVRVFQECNNPTAKIYCTGGLFLPQNNIFIGSAAENYINSINADILFLSSQAISEDGEISDASEEETALRRVMLTRAKKKIFLCDSSKIGLRRTFTLCNASDVDEIICDSPLPWEQKA